MPEALSVTIEPREGKYVIGQFERSRVVTEVPENVGIMVATDEYSFKEFTLFRDHGDDQEESRGKSRPSERREPGSEGRVSDDEIISPKVRVLIKGSERAS